MQKTPGFTLDSKIEAGTALIAITTASQLGLPDDWNRLVITCCLTLVAVSFVFRKALSGISTQEHYLRVALAMIPLIAVQLVTAYWILQSDAPAAVGEAASRLSPTCQTKGAGNE